MSTTSEVHSLKFNQNFGSFTFCSLIKGFNIQLNMSVAFLKGCFICGMTDGIRIFNTEPLVEKLYLSKLVEKYLAIFIIKLSNKKINLLQIKMQIKSAAWR